MDYQPLIKPPAEQMTVRPNLADYSREGQTFSWAEVRRHFSGLPGGGFNIAYECIDRHLSTPRRDKVALLWESKHRETERYTFADLARESNRAANGLRGLGVGRGDRVFTFLNRVPELYFSVFGILKVGAIVGTLYPKFGPDTVRERLAISGAKVLITEPSLWAHVRSIRNELPDLQHVVLVDRDQEATATEPNVHIWRPWIAQQPATFPIVPTRADDLAVMHYTPAITGLPQGAMQAHEALLAHYATGRYALDLHDEDIYWCTADPGWITGTSYGMFAPWSAGVTSIVYEGGLSAHAWYSIMEKYGVTVWYTAPTAIRMLMKAGDDLPHRSRLSSLRHICSVGELLGPEAIFWGLKVFGLPIHDTWWQTETGCILIGNYPTMDIRPGSMGRPFPGVEAAIIDEEGRPLPPGREGPLAIRPGWPSMFRTYWNNGPAYEARFRHGWYLTGDLARMDAEGYFWFLRRADGVINTAGYLVGPQEVERVLLEHPAVAEAGVIAKPDALAMEIVKAYVVPRDGAVPSDHLRSELLHFARDRLGKAMAPRDLEFLSSLPKTADGDILRGLLREREVEAGV